MIIKSRHVALAVMTLAIVPNFAWAAPKGSVLMESSSPEIVAKYRKEAEEKTRCAAVSGAQAQFEAYTQGAQKKWDRAAMGCALHYGTQAALTLSIPHSVLWAVLSFRANHIKNGLTVLGSNIEYFDVLGKSYAEFYQGIELSSELSVRWEQTRVRSKAILDHLAPLEGQVPEVRVLRAAYLLASTQKEAAGDQQSNSVREATKILEEIVKSHPNTLHGLPQYLLGQTLDRLPEFLGGDSDRALVLLEDAHRRDPTNLDYVTALATAYVGNQLPEKAASLIEAEAARDPSSLNPQDYFDDIKYISGLASRVGRADLSNKLDLKLKTLVENNPYIQQRKAIVGFGHSGLNPITGEEPDAVK